MQIENIDVKVARAFLSKLPLTLQNDSHEWFWYFFYVIKQIKWQLVNDHRECLIQAFLSKMWALKRWCVTNVAQCTVFGWEVKSKSRIIPCWVGRQFIWSRWWRAIEQTLSLWALSLASREQNISQTMSPRLKSSLNLRMQICTCYCCLF